MGPWSIISPSGPLLIQGWLGPGDSSRQVIAHAGRRCRTVAPRGLRAWVTEALLVPVSRTSTLLPARWATSGGSARRTATWTWPSGAYRPRRSLRGRSARSGAARASAQAPGYRSSVYRAVRAVRAEGAANEVVVDRRAGLLDPAASLPEDAPPTVVPADPPRGPARHHGPRAAGLIRKEAVAELRVLPVGVIQRVGTMGFFEHGFGDRVVEPAVVGLSGELQDPARDRDGNPVGGQLLHERVDPFPGRCAWER